MWRFMTTVKEVHDNYMLLWSPWQPRELRHFFLSREEFNLFSQFLYFLIFYLISNDIYVAG